jgi:hypothetical protein
MTTTGNYDCYFLFFQSGSSGNFLRFILHGLITQSDAKIDISDTNHVSLDQIDTGVRSSRLIRRSQDTSIRYCYFLEGSSKIARSHHFPSSDLINLINSDHVNPCIIVISGTRDEDLLEIAANHSIKCFNSDTSIREQVSAKITPLMYAFKDFGNSNNNRDNLLVIKYNEMFEPIEESFVGLRNLEDFTGIRATEKVLENYKTYIDGRNTLVKNNMKWLDNTL